MASNYARLREVRRARRILGRCIVCEEKTKHWRCKVCQRKQTIRQSGIYGARVALGLCGRCGKTPEDAARATCNACGQKMRDAVVKYRAKNRSAA